MRKITKSYLTYKLDKCCSDLVHERDLCQKCGGFNSLQTAHIFSRSLRSVRWDLDNLLLLCAKCHFWAHKNPILFTEFVRYYYSEYKYEQLKLKATMIKKWTLCEMQELLNQLQAV